MTVSEAIGILRLHRKWEKGVDIVKISQEDLQLAMDTITGLLDPKLIEGTTPNAWDMHFKRKLEIHIEELRNKEPLHTKQYSEGLLDGFEEGAEWVWNNFKLEKQITMWTQTTTNDQIKEDSIVEAIRTQLKDRSDVGIRKYNTTLDRTDLSLLDWLEHAKQEALDFALYLERIKREVKEKGLDG
jgi:hypothetical protein